MGVVGIGWVNTYSVSMAVSLGRWENEEVRLDLAREDLLGSFMVEVNDKWERLAADESDNGFFCDLQLQV